MRLRRSAGVAVAAAMFAITASSALGSALFVSVADQELAVVKNGRAVARYPVSTSKFGLGDQPGTYRTPVGLLYVSSKIGDNLPAGAVLKGRFMTGEVLEPDAPGRDPIVSRIIWLRGKEPGNQNARDRYIYIHGTAEEKTIGRPASYGCIRMRSKDVIALYRAVHIGTPVTISREPLSRLLPEQEPTLLERKD